jgi:glycosyltransferase involved in cell wall biosynthesis
MMMIVVYMAVGLIFAGTVLLAVVLVSGMWRLQSLAAIDGTPEGHFPLVSVLVPVRNEAIALPATVDGLFAQNYPRLEIIVIDDRSEDETVVVLQNLRQHWPELQVHRIDNLPEGWLGKSHALQRGAELAKGDFLLFIDGDVVMEATTITRAMRFFLAERVDHLTLLFKNSTKGWLLNSLILEMGIGMLLLFRPWAVGNAKSKAFIGVGAFNLIRREVYTAIGGHKDFRMHPIDDLMLGKAVKKHGYQQRCLRGHEFLSVPWYDSLTAMAKGLSKNMYSLVHYQLLPALLFVVAVFLLHTIPLLGLWSADPVVRLLSGGAIFLRLAVFARGLVMLKQPLYYLPTALLTPYLSSFVLSYAVVETIRRGGISWRGTFYPLAELRRSRPVWFDD